jgi:hypothetical protein
MRQGMDDRAKAFFSVLSWDSIELFLRVEAPLTSIDTGHIVLDID